MNRQCMMHVQAVVSGQLKLIPDHYEKQWKDWLHSIKYTSVSHVGSVPEYLVQRVTKLYMTYWAVELHSINLFDESI